MPLLVRLFAKMYPQVGYISVMAAFAPSALFRSGRSGSHPFSPLLSVLANFLGVRIGESAVFKVRLRPIGITQWRMANTTPTGTHLAAASASESRIEVRFECKRTVITGAYCSSFESKRTSESLCSNAFAPVEMLYHICAKFIKSDKILAVKQDLLETIGTLRELIKTESH